MKFLRTYEGFRDWFKPVTFEIGNYVYYLPLKNKQIFKIKYKGVVDSIYVYTLEDINDPNNIIGMGNPTRNPQQGKQEFDLVTDKDIKKLKDFEVSSLKYNL